MAFEEKSVALQYMGTPSNIMFLAFVVMNIEVGFSKIFGIALFRILSAAGSSLSALSTTVCKREIGILVRNYPK